MTDQDSTANATAKSQFKKALRAEIRNMLPGDLPVHLFASGRTFGLSDAEIIAVVLEVIRTTTPKMLKKSGGFRVLHPGKKEIVVGLRKKRAGTKVEGGAR